MASALPVRTVAGEIRKEMMAVWSVSLVVYEPQSSGALPSK